jgi:hypothetical protein
MQKARHSKSEPELIIFSVCHQVSKPALFKEPWNLNVITNKQKFSFTMTRSTAKTVIILESSNTRAINFKTMPYCTNGTNNWTWKGMKKMNI